MEKRFSKIEKALYIDEKGKSELLEDISANVKKTNGRVTEIEMWKARIEGGTILARVLWAIFGIVFISVAYGIFNMYIDFQKMEYTIAEEITKQLQDYEVKITK